MNEIAALSKYFLKQTYSFNPMMMSYCRNNIEHLINNNSYFCREKHTNI